MAEYNITMKQLNDQGEYDILYPRTVGSQVQGNIQSSQIEGKIPSAQINGTFPSTSITGQFPASQIDDLPTSLPANGGNADTVGGQTVQQIIEAAVAQGVQIKTGSYTGTGTYGSGNKKTLTFGFQANIVFIVRASSTGGHTYGNIIPFIRPAAATAGLGANYGTTTLLATWGTSTLSFYSTTSNAIAQLNENGITYYYVALG